MKQLVVDVSPPESAISNSVSKNIVGFAGHLEFFAGHLIEFNSSSSNNTYF